MQGERQSDERERSKNEIRAQNLRKAFSTPSTRMAFIALGVVFLIIVASFFRGGEKKQAVETAKIEEVKTPRIDDRSMPRVSEKEAENRKILAELAEELHLRIALPRSPMTCPTQAGSICRAHRISRGPHPK